VSPRTLKRWLILAAVVYLLLPRDLVPDFVGRGLGLIDDLAVIAGAIWFYRRRLRDLAAGAGDGTTGRQEERQERAAPSDPHAVLGVSPGASQEEIREAYRARMREYHPDKVAHLGAELQELAHRKAQEIQWAFETLRRGA
jgi:hypothetical protein